MNKNDIKEINKHISDALEQWCCIMNESDAKQWAYLLDYSDEDLFNAFYIFNHVAQNIAIKGGHINFENAERNMNQFRSAIKECFGFDTIELTNKVLSTKE